MSPRRSPVSVALVLLALSLACAVRFLTKEAADRRTPGAPVPEADDFPAMSALEDIEGRVVITHDGDTISLILDRPWTNGSRNLKIRLLGIDAPEIGQAYGSAARDTLFKRVQHRRVRVRFSQTDRYGRALADVYDGDRWINRELVAAGMAWNYSRPEDARLAAAQRTAASERRGLWSGKRPIPPWQWRQQNPRE